MNRMLHNKSEMNTQPTFKKIYLKIYFNKIMNHFITGMFKFYSQA